MKPNEFKFEDRILGIRIINEDKTSYGGFKNTTEVDSIIEAPDWSSEESCGGGIHFWPWGLGHDGKTPNIAGIWQVIEVIDESVMVEGKAKTNKVKVVYSGNQAECYKITMAGRISYIFENSEGSAANSGNRGSAANSGTRGSAANSGDYGSAANSGIYGSAANSGIYGSAANSGTRGSAANSGTRGSAANSGYGGSAANSGNGGSAANSGNGGSAANSGNVGSAANSGDYGSAANSGIYGSAANSGIYGSAANSGDNSVVSSSGKYSTITSSGENCIISSTGDRSKVKIKSGIFVLSYYSEDDVQFLVGRVPEEYKPDVWYTCSKDGKIVEADDD